ncbi:MAG: nitrilase-related carbon-nitrogen hydrolase [Thermodesulfovibrionales bacterium]|nr:nitrilase-related carbon-nitrogen hydrolase [Thermodesulfovibrionales bacterium]
MKIKAGFYQFNPVFGKKDDNLEKVFSAVKPVKDGELDLLVLPEFFAAGYQFVSIDEVADLSETIPSGRTTRFLSDLANEKGIYIAAGLPEREGRNFYNSAILVGPEGFIGNYRKTHLFFEEKLYFTPGGTGFRVWDTKMGRIGMMICFDWFFPESMRTLALMGAEVVAHPSNLVLPYCPQAMPIRCLENRLYAITANRTGIENRKEGQSLKFIGQSQITSYDGQILVKASDDKEELLVAEIEPEKAKNKSINPLNDLFKDRRPDMYAK